MSEKSSEWVAVRASEIDPPDKEIDNGIEVNIFLSPFDLPRAIRGSYHKSLDRFIIEFRYVDEEDFAITNEKENIAFRVGKKSRRLLGLQINTKALGVQRIELNVLTEAINRLIEKDTEQEHRDNYVAAREALAAVADRVLAPA